MADDSKEIWEKLTQQYEDSSSESEEETINCFLADDSK